MRFQKSVKTLFTLPFVFFLVVSCSTPPVPQATPTTASSDTPMPEPSATIVVPTDTPVPTETPAPTDTPAPTATDTPASGIVNVTYQDFEIVPSKITIKVGTRVVFHIKSASNDCHEPYSSFSDSIDISGLFDSGVLYDGATFAYTFRQAGTITIRCGCHPEAMVATVEVVE